MTTYRLGVASKTTGEEKVIWLSADSEAEATGQAATMGLVVSECKAVANKPRKSIIRPLAKIVAVLTLVAVAAVGIPKANQLLQESANASGDVASAGLDSDWWTLDFPEANENTWSTVRVFYYDDSDRTDFRATGFSGDYRFTLWVVTDGDVDRPATDAPPKNTTLMVWVSDTTLAHTLTGDLAFSADGVSISPKLQERGDRFDNYTLRTTDLLTIVNAKKVYFHTGGLRFAMDSDAIEDLRHFAAILVPTDDSDDPSPTKGLNMGEYRAWPDTWPGLDFPARATDIWEHVEREEDHDDEQGIGWTHFRMEFRVADWRFKYYELARGFVQSLPGDPPDPIVKFSLLGSGYDLSRDLQFVIDGERFRPYLRFAASDGEAYAIKTTDLLRICNAEKVVMRSGYLDWTLTAEEQDKFRHLASILVP